MKKDDNGGMNSDTRFRYLSGGWTEFTWPASCWAPTLLLPLPFRTRHWHDWNIWRYQGEIFAPPPLQETYDEKPLTPLPPSSPFFSLPILKESLSSPNPRNHRALAHPSRISSVTLWAAPLISMTQINQREREGAQISKRDHCRVMFALRHSREWNFHGNRMQNDWLLALPHSFKDHGEPVGNGRHSLLLCNGMDWRRGAKGGGLLSLIPDIFLPSS